MNVGGHGIYLVRDVYGQKSRGAVSAHVTDTPMHTQCVIVCQFLVVLFYSFF